MSSVRYGLLTILRRQSFHRFISFGSISEVAASAWRGGEKLEERCPNGSAVNSETATAFVSDAWITAAPLLDNSHSALN
jgi:hypothetical protein